jgi:hypothetical protein
VLVARLSVLYSRAKPRLDARAALRVKEDSKFKIVQIFDTHIVTSVGVYKDAINAYKKNLLKSKANPLIIYFIRKILDIETLDLIIFTRD